MMVDLMVTLKVRHPDHEDPPAREAVVEALIEVLPREWFDADAGDSWWVQSVR